MNGLAPPHTSRQSPYRRIVIVLAAAIAIGAVAFSFWRPRPVNYLIPGVPYLGAYNALGTYSSSLDASVAMILQYWGDNRFDAAVLRQNFPYELTTPERIAAFFREQGYEVEVRNYRTPQDFRRYINPTRRTPLLVAQRATPETRYGKPFRVIIGLLERDQKLIVHDKLLGNNYEISYRDFEEFAFGRKWVLAASPSSLLQRKLRGPDASRLYPPRTPAMDRFGPWLHLVSDANAALNLYLREKKYPEAVSLYQEIIADTRFSEAHPATRVAIYSRLAEAYLAQGKFSEAIEILNANALPINENLNQPFGVWPGALYAHSWRPLVDLGQAHLGLGNRAQALRAFEEAVRLRPDSPEAQRALTSLRGQ